MQTWLAAIFVSLAIAPLLGVDLKSSALNPVGRPEARVFLRDWRGESKERKRKTQRKKKETEERDEEKEEEEDKEKEKAEKGKEKDKREIARGIGRKRKRYRKRQRMKRNRKGQRKTEKETEAVRERERERDKENKIRAPSYSSYLQTSTPRLSDFPQLYSQNTAHIGSHTSHARVCIGMYIGTHRHKSGHTHREMEAGKDACAALTVSFYTCWPVECFRYRKTGETGWVSAPPPLYRRGVTLTLQLAMVERSVPVQRTKHLFSIINFRSWVVNFDNGSRMS